MPAAFTYQGDHLGGVEPLADEVPHEAGLHRCGGEVGPVPEPAFQCPHKEVPLVHISKDLGHGGAGCVAVDPETLNLARHASPAPSTHA